MAEPMPMPKGMRLPPPPTEEELLAHAQQRYEETHRFSIENWPASIQALSIETARTTLLLPAVTDLIEIIAGTMDLPHDPWRLPAAQNLASLAEGYLRRLGGKVFVRLGGRSPKDNPTMMDSRCRPVPAYTGRQVVEFLAYSERVLQDLLILQRLKKSAVLCLRRWVNIESEQEFRCFVEDGRFAGATQYYLDDGYSSWINANAQTIHDRLYDYVSDLIVPLVRQASIDTKGATMGTSFTCDVVLTYDMRATLLEVNPPVSSGLTFPGLFDQSNPSDFDGDLRYIKTLDRPAAGEEFM